MWGIHRRPVNSPHKRPVTRKLLPFDDVIMILAVPTGHIQHCHPTVTCLVTVATTKTNLIADLLSYQITENQFSWLSNIKEWRKRHKSHNMTRSNAILCVPRLINRPHRRTGHDTYVLIAVIYASQSNSKSYLQKKHYLQTPSRTCLLVCTPIIYSDNTNAIVVPRTTKKGTNLLPH